MDVLSQSFDPLKGLPYLEAVVCEAMRLYPAGSSASPRWVRQGKVTVPAAVQ
jgi:cytochrome P450